MSKTLLSSKHPQYTFIKGNTYYYTRAVPVDLSGYYSSKRIVVSLKTKSVISARIASRAYSAKLEQYWLGLRLQNIDVPAIHLVQSQAASNDSKLPLISEARDLYFKVKGVGRPELFFNTASRNVKYLVECLGERSLDEYSSKDAAEFRDWLLAKGLSVSSLQRIFSGIKAIVNFTILELGLTCDNPFTRVYLPTNTSAKKRHAIKLSNLIKIKSAIQVIDDDIRWLVGLIVDTGMRLSEAAGLMVTDIHLDCEIPHIKLVPHPHRRLKTASSERIIPLVGISLWSAKQIVNHRVRGVCFPRYTTSTKCNANSASASINKWLKSIGDKEDVIHGLRHSFRDRLRKVEAPSDMIDMLGGWSLRSVGQGYGDGYQLEQSLRYMKALSSELDLKR